MTPHPLYLALGDTAAQRQALGCFPGLYYRGHGVEEGILTGGDGGGTTFFAASVAGSVAHGARLSIGGIHPDIDRFDAKAGFGELLA